MFNLSRYFRYIMLMFRVKKRMSKVTISVIRTVWLLAYFKTELERSHVRSIINTLAAMEASLPRDSVIKTYHRLMSFKEYDRHKFLGIDLETSPTRDMLYLLHHFGDIDDGLYYDKQQWALFRDTQLSGKMKNCEAFKEEIEAMKILMVNTQIWVNKSKEERKK